MALMTTRLAYAGHFWLPLDLCDRPNVALDLLELQDQEHVQLRSTMAQTLETIVERHRQMGSIRSLAWVAFDSRLDACGWTCLVGSDRLESATYLHPRVWGTGLNRACKGLLWEMAAWAGLESFEISIDVRNVRSVKANSKLYPECQFTVSFDERRDRVSHVIVADRPPLGHEPLDESQRWVMRRLIESCGAPARPVRRRQRATLR
jgi:RimJ/RimL family protein N-acetyltransferase